MGLFNSWKRHNKNLIFLNILCLTYHATHVDRTFDYYRVPCVEKHKIRSFLLSKRDIYKINRE